MSLEAASYINALNQNNPEGTDPKSQGDDHLRMIKAVLKSQFSGLTQGKPIDLTEDQISRLGGAASRFPASNVDVVVPYTCVIAIVPGMTGTRPPGSVQGDMILNFVYDGATVHQLCLGLTSRTVWYRIWGVSAWTAWICLTPAGVAQTWINQLPGRALATGYTNNTGRPITVNVSAVASSQAQSYIEATVAGISVGRCSVADQQPAGFNGVQGFLSFVVPAGAIYLVNAGVGAVTLTVWAELR